MNCCVRILLIFLPSLIAFGLLGVAINTKWWTMSLEQNIPEENSFNITDDVRLHRTLIPITMSRGLLSECVSYRNVRLLVSNLFDFREDQRNLSNENCSNNQFTCVTSTTVTEPFTRCIHQSKRCDRIIDCDDKSDELSCDSNFQISDCPTGYVECLDGKSCYRNDTQTCDGKSDCIDKSDEYDCNEEKCRLNKRAYCSREKKCAARENSYQCDGIVDCEDNSDEENCEQCNGNTNTFSCDSKCFLSKHRCDNIVHCSDFRDELNCGDDSIKSNIHRKIYHNDRLCEEKYLNPFDFNPPKLDESILASYPNRSERLIYVNALHYWQLFTFYCMSIGLICILLSILSLVLSTCCHKKCRSVPFYFYGLWTLLACLCISLGLLVFVGTWIWKKETLSDHEKNSSFDIMIHDMNPLLKHLEWFGLSFWLACGAALATFIGLLISCFFCCTLGSSRSENKEYEIMQMHSY